MSQHIGWDGRYSHPEAEADSGQQWRTQLANLHQQWPEMAKQRSDREREIEARNTERQLHTTTQMLDSWSSGIGAGPGRSHPPPPALQLDHLGQAPQQSSLEQNSRPGPWNQVPWQPRRESLGDGYHGGASGMVGTTFSPTEPNHPPLHDDSSSASFGPYAPYSPYRMPPPPLQSNFGQPLLQPGGHWAPQGPPTDDFGSVSQRSDSYTSDSSLPGANRPFEPPTFPRAYPFDHSGHAIQGAPHASHMSSYPPTRPYQVDDRGRPLAAPWPQYGGHAPHPSSFYHQPQPYHAPPSHQPSMHSSLGPARSEPIYEPYSITPLASHSHGSHSHSPEDSRHSEPSPPQLSLASEAAPVASTSAISASASPLAPTIGPSTEVHSPAPLNEPIDFAASNKALLAKSKATTSKRSKKAGRKGPSEEEEYGEEEDEDRPVRSRSNPQARGPRKGSRRMAIDLPVECEVCSKPLARLILRGQQDELNVPHYPAFKCPECNSSTVKLPEADAEQQSSRSASSKPAFTSFRKRHKRPDSQSAVNACDVCLRDVAFGAVVPEDQRDRIDFQVEVVCASCDSRYRRCSDCGGGGGARLGVGKWRSKELFLGGRKTCSLPHVRLGALSDMFYDIHSVTDIPASEVDEIVDICGTIFSNTLYSGICIPEVFEHQSATAKTYAEVKVMASQGWMAISPMIKQDIEKERSIRRYLALRSCAPNPRKGAQPVPETPDDPPRVILRPKKDVVGFVISEWDMPAGCLWLAVVVPWALGPVYDATTILIQALFQRVEEDRRIINAQRAAAGLYPFPPVDLVWTMMFFQKDSRMIGHLEKKRGFSHLPEFLKANPDVDPAIFPPHRNCYLPVDRQVGWQVMVRRRDGPNDDFFAIRRTSASHEIDKKQNEKKARARREDELAAELE